MKEMTKFLLYAEKVFRNSVFTYKYEIVFFLRMFYFFSIVS